MIFFSQLKKMEYRNTVVWIFPDILNKAFLLCNVYTYEYIHSLEDFKTILCVCVCVCVLCVCVGGIFSCQKILLSDILHKWVKI